MLTGGSREGEEEEGAKEGGKEEIGFRKKKPGEERWNEIGRKEDAAALATESSERRNGGMSWKRERKGHPGAMTKRKRGRDQDPRKKRTHPLSGFK